MPLLEEEKCYLCRTWKSREVMTDDHIPPKSYFRPPRPTNLITVRCCEPCHKTYSMDDEAFRAWIASSINKSDAGNWIWTERVVNSSFKRSPKLRENMAKAIKPVLLQLNDGRQVPSGLLSFPNARGDRVLARFAKGLLSYFHPEYDYTYDDFSAHPLNEKTARVLEPLKLKLNVEQRGADEFKFGRCFTTEMNSGIWLFEFYGASSFIVMHGAGMDNAELFI